MAGLGRLSLWLLGAPALVEHMRQVGCVHLSELLIVTQSGGQVPVFAYGQKMTGNDNINDLIVEEKKTVQEVFLISTLTNEISTSNVRFSER